MFWGNQKYREEFSKQAMYLIDTLDEKIKSLLIDRILYFLLGFLVGGGFATFLAIVWVIKTYGG